ncbi:MAG: HlyD family efflux transporter periplasmic adaptor subunit [bacterium]
MQKEIKNIHKEPFKIRLKNKYLKWKQIALTYKKTSIVIAIVVIALVYWLIKLIFPTPVITSYVVSDVQKGSIITNVTGSGQVSASNQIDLKTKASGDILKVNVTTGQEVKAAQIIAQIDNPSAYLDYRAAQIAYEQFVQPADASTRIQAENDLNNTKQSYNKSVDNLNNAYDTGYSSVASSYLDMTEAVTGMNDILYSGSGYLNDQSLVALSSQTKTFKNNAGVNFDKVKNDYRTALETYRASSRSNSTSSIEQLIKTAYEITKEVSSTLKDLKNTVDYIKNQDPNSTNASSNSTAAVNASNNLINWIGKINSDLSNLSSSVNNINDLKDTIQNGPQTIAQKQANLDKVVNGADNLDIEAQRINLQQKQLTYQNLFVTAPFDGVIAKISIKPSDAVSSGASVGTIITKNKVADITVNEVDAAKILAGQKATLTFDAIDALSISGVVQSIDLVGTVTQGVVNYNVKITFDVQDDRVKSGMSVSASIITNNKQDVIVIPNSAVKSKGGIKYVELFSSKVATSTTAQTANEVPIQQAVEVGLSNDTQTEILSGLIVGDRIVTKTTTSSATAAKTTSTPSLFGGGGGTRAATGR